MNVVVCIYIFIELLYAKKYKENATENTLHVFLEEVEGVREVRLVDNY